MATPRKIGLGVVGVVCLALTITWLVLSVKCFPNYTRDTLVGVNGGISYLVDLPSLYERWHSVYFYLGYNSNTQSEFPGNITLYYYDKCPSLEDDFQRTVYLSGVSVGDTPLMNLNPGSTAKVSWGITKPADVNMSVQVVWFPENGGCGSCERGDCVFASNSQFLCPCGVHYSPPSPDYHEIMDYELPVVDIPGQYMVQFETTNNSIPHELYWTLDIFMSVYPTDGASSSCDLSSGDHCPYKKDKCMVLDFPNTTFYDSPPDYNLNETPDMWIHGDPLVAEYVCLIIIAPILLILILSGVVGFVVWKRTEEIDDNYYMLN